MCRWEAVRVGRTSTGSLGTVDISGRNIRLAERNHSATGIEGIAEAVAWRLGGYSAKVNKGTLALSLRLRGFVDGW